MLIGLTIAAFGTCAPELAISFNSMIKGSGDIVIANVLGSCIVNVLLIIGVSALFFPIRVKNQYIKKEIPLHLIFVILLSSVLIINMLNNTFLINRFDAIFFLNLFILFIIYIISLSKIDSSDKSEEKPKYNIKTSVFITIVCIIVIIIGSDLIVENAKYIANYLNISEKFISMTVVVIGTSLPELTMTVIAAKKKEFDISVGNIIGTNIFNIGIVLGLPILIYGAVSSDSFHIIDFAVLFMSGLIFYLFSKNDRVISKKEGFIMIFLFMMYYIYLSIF